MMSDSILDTTKKNLGMPVEYTEFDADVIMCINAALTTLTQLGVGPTLGFQITNSSEVWADLIGTDPRLNSAKNFVWLSSRLMFDPPSTSFAISAIEKQLEQMIWRIEITANPAPPRGSFLYDTSTELLILDGGDP